MRQTAEEPRESEAIANAKVRLDLLQNTVGTRNGEYATALNQLALLYLMQGDPNAAEPALRAALDVRREVLGERHPDYATNLSSLAGLLWARGDLDAAEPLLRQAVALRAEVLGPDHPKTVVSVNSLNQLLLARRDPAPQGLGAPPTPGRTGAPAPIVRLGPSVRPEHLVKPGSRITLRPEPSPVAADPPPAAGLPSVVTPVPLPEHAAEVAEAVALRFGEVSTAFADLADLLVRSGRALLEGRLPAEGVEETALRGAAAFTDLCRLTVDGAESLGLPSPAGGFTSLERIGEVVPALRQAEEARRHADRTRRQARAVLDRVDRLACPENPELAALLACRERSAELRRVLDTANPDEVPTAASRLAEGDHALVALLNLVRADDATDDAEWARWYGAVESELGGPLAVAAARNRMTLDEG